jgi:hypothetical protein
MYVFNKRPETENAAKLEMFFRLASVARSNAQLVSDG